jgi:hypothetical protein
MQLTGERTIPWAPSPAPKDIGQFSVIIGRDAAGTALEIVACRATLRTAIQREVLAKVHAQRLAKRVCPVVICVQCEDSAWIFGPQDKAAPIGPLPQLHAQRIMQAALDEQTGLLARQRLAEWFNGLSDAGGVNSEANHLCGIKNFGLFALHELRAGVVNRNDWKASCERAAPLLALRRDSLIKALGFTPSPVAQHAMLLTATGTHPRSVAVLLKDSETFDSGSTRFAESPVAYGLAIAQRQGVTWLILVRGSQLRLYPAKPNLGVGRKGLAETYFELDLALVSDQASGFLPLVFSADALAPEGTTQQLLTASTQYAVALGDRLRDRVYDDIVPSLATAVASQLEASGKRLDRPTLDQAYQLTLRIFFRMLFQAYAEDRKLLPYRENPRYDRNALKTVALDLMENPDQAFDPESTSLWDDLCQVWRVIDKGDRAWSVPAYNGGLFSSDQELHPEGALLETLRISNDVIGPVLKALLIDAGDGITGPIDFRSLSIREFGTIYEGLLESSLAVADTDLTIGKDNRWIPANQRDPVVAKKGTVYFHNTSGQRKGTGSYFTPSFVVEHLLERSLDPALDAHLASVSDLLVKGDQAEAGAKFFDFRIADLAMGSGHFLTSAIDHVETRMAAFLAEHPIPGVTAELARLRQAARDAMGADSVEPETTSLLRRQIARRCIYGLDINPIAVELARVSIWIHTFVRGLPMSSLDHNLVCANSLTGIGTMDEALDALVPDRKGGATLFDGIIAGALEEARELLINVANAAEATRHEAQQAARTAKRAREAAAQAKCLFDAAVLMRIGHGDAVPGHTAEEIAASAAKPRPQSILKPLMPAHMPFLFPEVFMREQGGFDVLVGNPPWEEVMVEEPKFWLRVAPGLLALTPAELKKAIATLRLTRPELIPELETEIENAAKVRAVLLRGPYPGLGKGDVDLYRVFAWRNLHLLAKGGRLGTLFPRSLLNAAGNAPWRERALASGELEVITAVNSANWMFESVDVRYSVALVVFFHNQVASKNVRIGGPFFDANTFQNGRNLFSVISTSALKDASSGAALPQLPAPESPEVFAQLRNAPRLDAEDEDWAFRPVAEFHATNDRSTFDAGGASTKRWRVYGGLSFNLWQPDTGEYYTWAEPDTVVSALFEKRKNQARLSSSAFRGLSSDSIANRQTLPCFSPRIAVRDVTNATNTRTVIAALVPAEVVLINPAPYLLRRAGDERTEAFLLGVLASLPLDWYARRYVELHLNLHILNGLPIPRPRKHCPVTDEVILISGRLAARDHRFADWAKAVRVEVGSVKSPLEQQDLEARLDGLVARLYGLSASQLAHIYETFHRGWDYEPRLRVALRHFNSIEATA